uniref:Myosin motor domain-containing protein n=1 Tax=Toxocara canis TaxID=6265 RepID=A0A183U9V5_TOXCA
LSTFGREGERWCEVRSSYAIYLLSCTKACCTFDILRRFNTVEVFNSEIADLIVAHLSGFQQERGKLEHLK